MRKSLWGKTIDENVSTASCGETPVKQGREENGAFIAGAAVSARGEKARAEAWGRGVRRVKRKLKTKER